MSVLTSSVLSALYLSSSIAIAQEEPYEPPVYPEVVEEQPEEDEVVRDVDEEAEEDMMSDEPLSEVEDTMSIQQAVNAPNRRVENRERDRYRNPEQTLEFFGIQPHMTVVEIWPGQGWYTEILAPYLSAEGTLYAAHFPEDSDSDFYREARGRYAQFLQSSNVYNNVQLTTFMPGSEHEIAPEGSADMVLTFRNMHNWYMGDEEAGMKNALEAFYKALRPGGVLGVVDHRLPEDRDDADAADSGYIKESWVVEAAENAGFELVESSEINANPADTADHEGGVWTLPPTLRHGDDEQGSMSAIGESDRFTLKFRKPEE